MRILVWIVLLCSFFVIFFGAREQKRHIFESHWLSPDMWSEGDRERLTDGGLCTFFAFERKKQGRENRGDGFVHNETKLKKDEKCGMGASNTWVFQQPQRGFRSDIAQRWIAKEGLLLCGGRTNTTKVQGRYVGLLEVKACRCDDGHLPPCSGHARMLLAVVKITTAKKGRGE